MSRASDILVAIGLLALAPDAQTCRRDESGIRWTLPFAAARERARADQRLLFVKPIAFGTSADGGW